MNRTMIMLVAVLLLGGVAWLAVQRGGADERVSLAENDRQFAYEKEADIQRIYIADRKGHEVDLTRGGKTGWLVDGDSPANPNVMKNLLQAITRIDIRTLPARNTKPKLIRGLATEGILVRVFDAAGNKLRGYYIGGGAEQEYGVGAIMEGSENPCLVHLPNFTGNIRHRYSLWGDEWRHKVVLEGDPDRVDLLEVRYPTQQASSFTLTKDGKEYTVTNPFNPALPPRAVPRGVAEGVLSRFEQLYAVRFTNGDQASLEEARGKLPFASVRLREAGGEEQTLHIHPEYIEKGYTHDLKSGEVINLEGIKSYHALANGDRDWVLLSPERTEPLFVGYDSF